MSLEKEIETGKNHETRIDLKSNDSSDGEVLDVAKVSDTDNVKLSKDGKTILLPQPSDDPNDPLNWSWTKKHVVLFIVSMASFLPDFGSAAGAVILIPQALEWGTDEDGVLKSMIGNILMVGVGGVVAMSLMNSYGRLPVLFWFLVMAVWTAAFCAASTSLEMFIGARILNGFFSTVAQSGGQFFIYDMFFVHEYARKINIWSYFVLFSPYMGPMLAAFITIKYHWQWPFWLFALLTGLVLLGSAFFVDETYYDRRPGTQQPVRRHRFLRVIGVEQWQSRKQRTSLTRSIVKNARTLFKPVVFLSVLYSFLYFAWVVGVNTTLSIFLTPLYNFGPREIGLFYFTPIIATTLAEVAGHWVHDWFAAFSMRRNNGHLVPEARLLVIYTSTPLMVAGLVLLGYSLESGYHFMITSFGWGLYVFGIMITTVAISTYLLSAYPEASGEVAAWLTFARVFGGFFSTLFQIRWARATGPRVSFGIQAGIIAGATFIVLFLHLYGARVRKWSGPVTW